jgi:tetratricopeptide (TPR) repeat protein
MTKFLKLAFLGLLFSGLLLTIGTAMADEALKEDQSPKAEELSAEEQNKKAMEAFRKILELTESAEDRASILEPLEAAYREIIEKYPKAYLSQECYWKLMTIYISESNPPLFEKAEKLYDEFMKKYPDSQLKFLLGDTLADGYYKNGKWEKILQFYAPVIKEFIKTEKLSRASEMFLYSEAKFHMGDFVEAEKGYNIVISRFPGSKDGRTSKKRLEEIKVKKSKSN